MKKRLEGRTEMAKISVIIPVYKAEDYIAQMIESVLSQSLNELELILVDDGSPDKCGKICDEYAETDSRVHVIHKQNSGVGAARNDGLNMAKGEWVIFCDSDDWLEKDALKSLIKAGEESGADIVFGDVNLVEGDKVIPAIFYKKAFITSDRDTIDKLIAADFCKTYCFDPADSGPAFGYGGPWNKIVRRRLLVDNNIQFDLRVKGIFDDIIYTAYIFAAANKVQYVHDTIYNYRQLPSSITHQFKSNLPQINKAIFMAWEEFIEKYGSAGQFQKPFYANVIRRYKSLFDYYFFHPQNQETFDQQMAELKLIIRTEPYRSAIKKADYNSLLNKSNKLLWIVSKLGSPRLIWLILRIRNIIKCIS